MPITYERHDETRRIRVTASGVLTLRDILAVIDRQLAEGAWTYSILYDAHDLTAMPSADEVRKLAARVEALAQKHGRRGAIAIVTSSDAVYGTSRMYAALSEQPGQTISVFRAFDEAERWLAGEQAPQD
ncbi:MAG: hypothetical protein AAB403_19055 [Planctomycetota bacterium]